MVHQLIDGRNVGDEWISFFARLQDRPDKSLLVPGKKRLAGEVGADRQIAAVQLAALDAGRGDVIDAGRIAELVTGAGGELAVDVLLAD